MHFIVKEMSRDDVQFICVGGGTELPAIINYAGKKDVSEFITFTGRVSDRQLLEALNTSDLCVNPDEFNDMNDKSTMNKVMEYMALGKPIVQFDLTEGRYSAQEASLYAKPNDAVDFAMKILYLLDHPEERIRRGQFGYERVKNQLEWQREKENLYQAYRKVFNS